MEDTSYIKLFRKILKSPIWDNEKALKIWIWCLLKATHTERKQLVGQQVVDLEKGQFIFGRKKASEELKMTESTIYKYIKLLEELEMLTVNSNNKFSVVSIAKWENYQVEGLKNNNKETTKEQQSNTNKNVKNIYLYLFNKYSEHVREAKFSERLKLMREIKNSNEYQQLDAKEQTMLYAELMSLR